MKLLSIEHTHIDELLPSKTKLFLYFKSDDEFSIEYRSSFSYFMIFINAIVMFYGLFPWYWRKKNLTLFSIANLWRVGTREKKINFKLKILKRYCSEVVLLCKRVYQSLIGKICVKEQKNMRVICMENEKFIKNKKKNLNLYCKCSQSVFKYLLYYYRYDYSLKKNDIKNRRQKYC